MLTIQKREAANQKTSIYIYGILSDAHQQGETFLT
jgi:hypothetical protein